jgi:site-specific recombinase XerD
MNQEFEQAMKRFIQHIRLRYPNRATATHYQSDLEQFRQVIDKAPRAVTSADVTEFVTAQRIAGLSVATVNRRLATLSSFFEFLADDAGDDHWANPVAWHRHRLKTGHYLPRDLPEAIARQFWQTVCQGPVRDQALNALMLDVGLRVGEVVALRLQDFEPALHQDELAALRVRGKGDKERRVWLVPETAAFIQEWLAERPTVADEALFITRRRAGFSKRGIQERVKHYTVKAGLDSDQVSCHRLRHTFSRRMAEARMPLPSLSHWLGHNQLTTTQRYIAGANPNVRADYQAAMSSLPGAAERPDTLTVSTQSSPASSAPPINSSPPPWSATELAAKVSALPPWLRSQVVDFVLAQQARWHPHHRRARAAQWLGELRRAWTWLLGEHSLSGFADLSRTHLHAHLVDLQERELSAHTINHFLTTFWSFLHFVEERAQPIAPGLYRVPRPKKSEWQPRPFKEAEYLRLEQAVLTATTQDANTVALQHSWFFILSDGGLRIGELETLAVDDWDPDGHTLHIRHGKGGRERRVPITSRLTQALAIHLDSRPTVERHEPLLLYRGKAITAPYVRNRLHAFADQAQVKDATPHRLRHTYATRLLNTGRMPVTTLQKLMGHRYLDTTMRYAALYDQTIRDDYAAAMAQIQSRSESKLDRQLWGPAIEAAFQKEAETVGTPQSEVIVNCM